MIAPLLATLASLTQVGVAEREWRLSAYVPVVPRGAVAFNVHNYGEDAHDLQVRGPRGYRSAVSPEIAPGQNLVVTLKLRRRGTYRLVCALPGHEKRGMWSTLRVR